MGNKHFIVAAMFAAGSSVAVSAQVNVASFVGKKTTDPQVAEFMKSQNTDAYGMSYDNGIQVYSNGDAISEIVLFNKTTVNGRPTQTYKGELPYKLTFQDTPETIKNKLTKVDPIVRAGGNSLIWELKDVVVEVFFTDNSKKEISHISFSNYFLEH